jgi:glycosyltransferase involved in cell wall biosynthesis
MTSRPESGSRLGFACAWGPNPAETWSGTPFRLRAALAATGPVVDLDAELPRPVQVGLKAASARRHEGRWTSMWKHGAAARALTERKLAARAAHEHCDAVLTIQDLGVLPVPFMVLQDLSYDALLDVYEGGVPHFPGLGRPAIERLRDRQLHVYEKAAVLLPMSRWLGDRLVKSGVPSSKVVPVHPGVNVPVPMDEPVPERRRSGRRRLLFIGRDPHTKALDVVVAAFERLRPHADVALTVAGPPVWPLPGAVPEGVDYLGPVSRDRVATLMADSDLFVMPSRLEGFGIAFVEALARGLPCVGRNAYAMPEIIEPGTGGALVDDDDPDALAAVIAETLENDQLYERCAANAPAVRSHYTWERAAGQVWETTANIS